MHIKTISTLILISTFITGCNGSNSAPSNDPVKEFISLDKKANYENGNVTIDDKRTILSYSGFLLSRVSSQEYQPLGIAFLNEVDYSPIVIMSTEDELFPDFKKFEVNIPDTANGFTCNEITHQEKKSTVIKDNLVIVVKAEKCIGKGNNAGLTKDIDMTLTESMFTAGTSRIDLIDGSAHLNTEIQITDNLFLSGGLGTRTYNQIFDLITNNPEFRTIIEGQISGSIHDEINLQTGRLIRKAGLSTHITSSSYIASGAVDLFCSGVKRTMEDGAEFGVHSWSSADVEAGDLPDDSPLHNDQITYFTEMLGSPIGKDFYFFTIKAATADNVYQMSRSEIESYNILTDISN
ncbi:MAG: hypothetical protein HAW67_01930 [Endozoicomonadaceae bacterium]|nr:hypothetical protein [Endozoicomonadaceae bacterium]